MTDIPTLLENFAKNLRKQLKPIDEVLHPQTTEERLEEEETILEEDYQIPTTKIAVFWDYENFPLPKGINDMLFFESLFSSVTEEQYILKRVYAKPEIIQPKLSLLEKNGFEFKQGLRSGKSNEIDHVLMLDCNEYCSTIQESLVVILIAGDVDYIALVEKLATNGHEVRIICDNKQKVTKKLQNVIPAIIDKSEITSHMEELDDKLRNLTALTNYFLTLHEDNMINFDDLYEIIIKYYTKNLTNQIKVLFQLMFEHPDYNWQFTISNEFVQKTIPPPPTDALDPVQTKVLARTKALSFQLAYEEDYEQWSDLWLEYCSYKPEKENQRKFLKELNKDIILPHIRNFAQRELVKILLLEQLGTNSSQEKIFKTKKDINDFIHNLHQKDELLKNKYPCTHCKRKFISKSAKKQHTKAAHENKRPPFLCPICGKNIQNKKSLENHQNQAHKENDKPLPFECNRCYVRLQTEIGMKDHKKKRHNED
jgi:hypothetical protein